jgi:hypothetical protein
MEEHYMRFLMILILLQLLFTGSHAATDSTAALFEQGIAAWDSTLLRKAFVQSAIETPRSDFLFKATCLWRLQIISYVNDDKKATIHHGKQALELLDSAAGYNENAYLINARRTYVTQLLAGTSLKNGATYGPRTGKYLDAMRKLKPQGFETRFISAVNLLEMPSFVGGDPKKSQELLLELHQNFPDSAAVTISLARAMIKNKQKEKAQNLLDQVLQKNPKDLWAKKVRKEIK